LKITYEGKDMGDIATKIDKTMATMHMPPGYKWSKGNSFREMEETNNATKFALYLAAVFVLLLMGVLFESFILPFSIIISIPLAFIGSFWGLWLTNSPFGFMASTGTLILIGIVVNNGIVLIDHINMLRKEGMTKTDAIIKGSKDRSRPILMTAITTITGLIPLAMGKGDLVGISYAPLAITVIGGLTTSTMLTLFIVPVFYSLLDSLREFISSFVMSFFSEKQGKRQSTKV
jgi:HAE1 family hydrophobic/amphiphilic exporter-1